MNIPPWFAAHGFTLEAVQQQIEELKPSRWGRFIYRYCPYRLSVMRANIDQEYGDVLNVVQKKRLAQAFYSHALRSLKEILALRFMSERKVASKVDVKGYERVLDVAAKGQGVLILTGHFGNWEFAPLGGILNFKQFQGKFHFIRRTLHGAAWLERILFRRYFNAGLQVIPKKNSLTQVCDVLAAGNAVVFVLDQYASPRNRDGVPVEFFGKKVGTYRSLAMLSRYTGVPVVPAFGYRESDGRHVLMFGEPIAVQDDESSPMAIYKNTLAYNQALERIILARPEQWLWLHKRWKRC
jgi:KDO2-lipid IV(A) lauroyltransferase